MGKQLAREIFPWDLLEARLEFYFHSQLECRYFIFMPSSRILLGEQSCYQILLKFSAPPLLLCQNVNGFIWEIVFIQQTFISLEFICLISVTSQIRFKLNLLGKNLVTERWQTTKYLSSFQQQPNFFHPNYTFVFVFVFHWILVFSRHSCWWEEVVKKITSQEGNFFTLFVDCYCITILKKMCWCWCTDAYRYTHADALMMIYDADAGAGELWIFRVQGRVFPVSIFLLMVNDLFWLIDK